MISSSPALAEPGSFIDPAFRPSDPAGVGTAQLMRVLDELDHGLMIVTDAGRIRLANQAAAHACTDAQGLEIRAGHVVPSRQPERDALARALAGARVGRRSLLVLGSGSEALTLAVVPAGELVGAAGGLATLLVFGRRRVCEPLSLEFYAREHRLTMAERAVLKALCGGQRPAQIARGAGVALSTVRSQIGSIRLKTGTTSIGDLIRRLVLLPPIVPVLNRIEQTFEHFVRMPFA